MRVNRLKLKLQLVCGDVFAIGPGKAEVLEAIDREGSISAAGRALGMSYRRIWLLADEMNRCFENKLIETQKGGNADRGAKLTEAGRSVLNDFRALESRAAAALTSDPAYTGLLSQVRDTPLPPKPTR
ncbi:winged helix-turn-helix domain-containing protein [Sphingomonas immobilis]|uniref:LysR family transcriptional regulator n=1 Tax=Sphingomonas immobilis TaxID=3063997 RepID=A0ABT9A2N3_9SPHN|nr:LysR family transcriptional regulator [Sphingomonas sp. CA1-15]MDO7844094.1 LysR family transcriptional regulator [Sphingomonas sp. CA1-15]